jgi:hypothetical protein
MKKCVRCDQEFTTPGIQCEPCRNYYVPTMRNIKLKKEAEARQAMVIASRIIATGGKNEPTN